MTGRVRISTAGISAVTDLGRPAGGAVGQGAAFYFTIPDEPQVLDPAPP